jgi:hypothetical protein
VNAAVFSRHHTLLSLVVPPRKDLLIGLGLVNVVNLSEFKAVLAHEFGHFSQDSTLLAPYVYRARAILGELAYGRDWFDEAVDRLCRSGSVLALVGWPVWGVVSAYRMALEAVFYGLTFADRALSREMELHADRVAVSVAGSDAIVRALCRLDFATQALDQAADELRAAADHRLYSRDLFAHHLRAADHLRRLRQDPRLGLPPPLNGAPGVDVFAPGDDGVPPMWATHPSNFDRERGAKEPYLPCPLDERSPWELFDGQEALRERLTHCFYRAAFGLRDLELTGPDAVQAFIDAEHAETTYDPRYRGLYDNRYVDPGGLHEHKRDAEQRPWQPATLREAHAALLAGGFARRMAAHHARREEYNVLADLQRRGGEPAAAEVEFRGRDYELGDVGRLLRKVDRELEDDYRKLAEVDARVFRTHYQMAVELGREVARELWARYEFHLEAQKIGRSLGRHRERVEEGLAYLFEQPHQRVPAEDFQEALGRLRQAHRALSKGLQAAERMKVPELKHVAAGQALADFLLERRPVREPFPDAGALSAGWIRKFMGQLSEAQERLRRIHFKSLGGILALQERIAERWLREAADAPEVTLAEEVPDVLPAE